MAAGAAAAMAMGGLLDEVGLGGHHPAAGAVRELGGSAIQRRPVAGSWTTKVAAAALDEQDVPAEAVALGRPAVSPG